ncbi:MAG: hypothetical protein J5742_04185 [Alphaproteobacteria bacterium]|nr:hypothetical protein [Alphaproteobacteria bacterium]
MMTKKECTPEFMLWIIKHIDPLVCLETFLTIVPEDEIPEEVKIAAARKSQWGEVLYKLHHPSDAVINAALETAGEYIVYVKNPTEQQWILALQHSREHPKLITKCPKPTLQMQKIHVARYLDGIDYIENPCEAVKIAAAEGNGIQVLSSIKHPSEQVILTAIAHTLMPEIRDFLHYIPHPNHKMYCAMRHQVKIDQKIRAQIKSEKEPQPPEPTELDYGMLIKKCAEIDPLRTAQATKPDAPIQEKKAILSQLYDELRTNALNDLLGYKNLANAM